MYVYNKNNYSFIIFKKNNMENQEIYFEVGDLVTCAVYGHGKVVEVDGNIIYPITVEFNSDFVKRCYTFDGSLIRGCKRTLFHGHVDIQEPVLVPKNKFKKGDIVIYNNKILRFISTTDDGMCNCLSLNGETYTIRKELITLFSEHPFIKEGTITPEL